jgi:hypothetical protein
MKREQPTCIARVMATTAGADLRALVLAGGDGTRLQALPRLISGASIPTQMAAMEDVVADRR